MPIIRGNYFLFAINFCNNIIFVLCGFIMPSIKFDSHIDIMSFRGLLYSHSRNKTITILCYPLSSQQTYINFACQIAIPLLIELLFTFHPLEISCRGFIHQCSAQINRDLNDIGLSTWLIFLHFQCMADRLVTVVLLSRVEEKFDLWSLGMACLVIDQLNGDVQHTSPTHCSNHGIIKPVIFLTDKVKPHSKHEKVLNIKNDVVYYSPVPCVTIPCIQKAKYHGIA